MDPKIIQAVFAPCFLLMGLSHLVQPRLWVRFFEIVRDTGVAAFIIPIYTLPFALVLNVGHNLWVWDWPVVLTIAGWIMTIKCTLYLLVPGLVERVLSRRMTKSERTFQIAGAIMAVPAAVITWRAWT